MLQYGYRFAKENLFLKKKGLICEGILLLERVEHVLVDHVAAGVVEP